MVEKRIGSFPKDVIDCDDKAQRGYSCLRDIRGRQPVRQRGGDDDISDPSRINVAIKPRPSTQARGGEKFGD
jgi:hypothetical protein